MGLSNREAAFAALKDRKLSPGAALLLVYIGDLVADDGGILEVGCDYMADALGQSVSSVRRWRDELVDAGHLVSVSQVRGGPKGNTYRLTLHPRTVTNPPPTDGQQVQPSTHGGSNPPLTLHQPSTHGGEQEQQQKEAAAVDEVEARILAAARTETERRQRERSKTDKPITHPEQYARKLAAAPNFRAQVLEGTNPSPARNSPAECPHRAMDDEGWCAACSTQVRPLEEAS